MLNQALKQIVLAGSTWLALIYSPGLFADSGETADMPASVLISNAAVKPKPIELPNPNATAANNSRSKRQKSRSGLVSSNSRTADSSGYNNSTFLLEEAKNLIVSNQPYRLRFEDEESLGKVSQNDNGTVTAEFSPEEVEQYRTAVQTIGDYRNKVRNQCLGASTRYFLQALDKYLSSVASFNRKALPLVADISENNSSLVLVVNRTPLIDAPVLTSRYLQFKKQRFKEVMSRFLPSDNQLVASMVAIARILKVNVNEEDWNRSYGMRDNALELVSLWPRELIFDATERLSEAHETACIIDLRSEATRRAESTIKLQGTGKVSVQSTSDSKRRLGE